jgi:hypothetical protein
MVSIVSSERFAKEETRISSFTTSPGVVASDIGELPMWITKARIILHYIVSSVYTIFYLCVRSLLTVIIIIVSCIWRRFSKYYSLQWRHCGCLCSN